MFVAKQSESILAADLTNISKYVRIWNAPGVSGNSFSQIWTFGPQSILSAGLLALTSSLSERFISGLCFVLAFQRLSFLWSTITSLPGHHATTSMPNMFGINYGGFLWIVKAISYVVTDKCYPRNTKVTECFLKVCPPEEGSVVSKHIDPFLWLWSPFDDSATTLMLWCTFRALLMQRKVFQFFIRYLAEQLQHMHIFILCISV